jgi:hypothetical protein
MNESLVLGLPNGKACYFTSTAMRTVAKYLRWETFKRGQYSHAGFELQVDDTVIDIGANIGMFALWAEPQIPQRSTHMYRTKSICPRMSEDECSSERPA